MKLFQRLLRGASSGHGFVRFLCFFNQMFSENEFFKNAANPLTDQNLSIRLIHDFYLSILTSTCYSQSYFQFMYSSS